MDVGVTDEILNGVDYEESSSSEDEAQGTLVIKINTYLKLTVLKQIYNALQSFCKYDRFYLCTFSSHYFIY